MYLSLILLQTIFNYEKKIITKSYYMYSLVLFLQNKQIEHSIDSIFCALNYIFKKCNEKILRLPCWRLNFAIGHL